ncbi:MAG: bacteriohemerythrin [Gammaproteobacteria bacterium]|nr:bacteriohemerythrin [Gammaproteobacteria bacterium]MCW9055657.1 bacteriohemerythrin [Gammaproteobacteria bacterium]
MNDLVLSSVMKTGITLIDEQHQLLIDLVKDFENAINEDMDDHFVEGTLEELINYVSYHFKAEEELMAHHNYPGFSHHKEKHDDLVKKVIDFHERFKKKELNLENEILVFLKDWIVNHITKSDMEYVLYIN